MSPRFRTIAQRLRQTPVLTRKDFALLLIPLVLWGAIERGIRPRVTEHRCHLRPETCQPQDLWAIDRATVEWESRPMRNLSDKTQNASGMIAALLPLALHLGRAAAGSVSLAAAVAGYGTDLMILLQGVFINGTLNGVIRSVVQRPRPGAYRSPHGNGKSESQYTSFYSGHTSFAAVTMASLLFTLMGRRRTAAWLLPTAAVGIGLIAATGWFRVTGGAHFPTDVLFAPFPAIAIALWLALAHRPDARREPRPNTRREPRPDAKPQNP